MHNSVFCLPLMVGVFCIAPLQAQQAYFPNPQNLVVPASEPLAEGYASPLRWRPLETETEQTESSPINWTPREGSTVFDYTDEPLGLPRGTYRRIEQRHTITPHSEGYRFRPIKPEEQQRNRQRNQSSDRVRQDVMSTPPAAYDTHGQGRQAPAFQFRPDARLDSQPRGAPSRYSYPVDSSAPVFRPQ